MNRSQTDRCFGSNGPDRHFMRDRNIPDIKSRSRQRRQHAERTAINMPLQGTCADILKKSLLLIDNWIQNR